MLCKSQIPLWRKRDLHNLCDTAKNYGVRPILGDYREGSIAQPVESPKCGMHPKSCDFSSFDNYFYPYR
jgi:hypothetical protein